MEYQRGRYEETASAVVNQAALENPFIEKVCLGLRDIPEVAGAMPMEIFGKPSSVYHLNEPLPSRMLGMFIGGVTLSIY